MSIILNSKVHLFYFFKNYYYYYFRVDAERELQEIIERIVVVLSVAGFLQQLQASSVCGHAECQTFGSFK